MKDIMKELEFSDVSKYEACEKWREYCAAEKIHRSPEYTELKKGYMALKNGWKLINIFKVIRKGGLRSNYHPRLAICRADKKKVYCHYENDGEVRFYNEDRWRLKKGDIQLPKVFPPFDAEKVTGNAYASRLRLSAPVPLIPASIMPKKLTDDYYILWEVEKWTMEPPTDPYLLSRIGNFLFVVVAEWDLTELEKTVMHGRLH